MLKNLAFALFLLFYCSAGAEDQYRNSREHKLDNGITVILAETSLSDLIRVALCVSAGSADEIEKEGVANLLSKVLTKKFMNGVDENSVQYGSESNSYVGYDQSVYYFCGTVKNLEYFLKTFGELLKSSAISGNEVTTAKNSVERDIANDEHTDRILARKEARKSMYWHVKYGSDVNGTPEKLKFITGDDILRFKKNHYSPDKVTLILCFDPSKINQDAVLQLANKYFGDIGARTSPTTVRLQEPPHHGSVVKIVKNSDQVSVPVVEVYYSIPSYKEDMPKALATEIYINYLDTALQKSLVDELKISSGISFAYSLWNRNYGDFCISIMLRNGIRIDDALTAILSEIKYIASEGMTDEYLNKAKQKLFDSSTFDGKDIMDILDRFTRRLGAGNSLESVKKVPDNMKKCSLEEVNTQGRAIFKKDPSVICVIKPRSDTSGGSIQR
jgi:zinc protease